MASKRIQGITVEIGGDTSKLTAALKDVDKSLSTTQGNLRDVNKLLKLDPGNTELLAQKHRLLGDAVKETKPNDTDYLRTTTYRVCAGDCTIGSQRDNRGRKG